jgi:cytochrome c556
VQKAVQLIAGLALAAGTASVASAQDVKPENAIKYRQGILRAQAWNMGIMGAMVKGAKPFNKDEFLLRATYLHELSAMAWEGFTPGSDQGAPTRAKPEVWKDPAKFKQLAEALQAATAKLDAAAKTGGTLDAVKGPFGEVAKACDNCHDDFRSK